MSKLLAEYSQLATKLKTNKSETKASYIVQPNEEQQRHLYIINLSKKMVTHEFMLQQKIHCERLKANQFRSNLIEGATPNDYELQDDDSIAETIDREKEAWDRYRPAEFLSAVKYQIPSGEYFEQKLKIQKDIQLKNAKSVFNSLTQDYKHSITCNVSYKREYERIDCSAFAKVLQQQSALQSQVNLDDANTVKKKEGICIIVDPSYNTENLKVKLQIHYVKHLSLTSTEDVVKEYPLWADKDYSYQLALSMEYHPSKIPNKDDHPCYLPGWGTRPPIFVPAVECRIVLIKGDENVIGATQSFKLSNKLRLFAMTSSNIKIGVKKLNDFVNNHFSVSAANVTVPGSISSLSIAAQNGHINTVALLVEQGADVNTRNKNSRYNTALIDATLESHREVATYLLEHGANQMLKDEMGCTALHHACRLGDIAMARILVKANNAKKALLLQNNNDQRPFDVCATPFMKIQIEEAMKRLKVFVKPRVSLLARNII